MNAVGRRLRLWLIVTTLALVGGCSAVRLGYDQAEPVLRWWADRHLDLNAGQSRWLKDELRAFHTWHRRTQLPAYADLAATLARQSAGDVSAAQVCENLDSATAHIDFLLRQAAPLLAGLSRQLDVTQLQHLKRHFAEEDREWRDKWLDVSPERRTQLRMEDWTERAQSYYGRLTREQREFILRAVQRSSWDPQLSWERRQLRQQHILFVLDKVIRQRLSQTAAEEEILVLIERSLRPEDVRIAGMQRMLLQEACNNLSGLHQLSTEAQRLRARDKLLSYEQDFRQLAAKR